MGWELERVNGEQRMAVAVVAVAAFNLMPLRNAEVCERRLEEREEGGLLWQHRRTGGGKQKSSRGSTSRSSDGVGWAKGRHWGSQVGGGVGGHHIGRPPKH